MSSILSSLGRASTQRLVARVPSQRPFLTRSTPALHQTRHFRSTPRTHQKVPGEYEIKQDSRVCPGGCSYTELLRTVQSLRSDIIIIDKRTVDLLRLNEESFHERVHREYLRNRTADTAKAYTDSSGTVRVYYPMTSEDKEKVIFGVCTSGEVQTVEATNSIPEEKETTSSYGENKPYYIKRAFQSLRSCLWASP
ncbi:hypothetical protein NW762_011799 [Fusarium torreyae]|uniref:Uncharacterized protein n=1 Tax=Fusarium torreyae TaxID=1237075 RepID=A0A9W8RSE2_9HYPO|nr:hypothetical protein NW762_011799 [Fusarium torreyae]